MSACMAAIRRDLTDINEWFFGTPYPGLCPLGFLSGIGCVNPRGNYTDSISTRTYPQGGMNVSAIDRYLKMTFSSEPGKDKKRRKKKEFKNDIRF